MSWRYQSGTLIFSLDRAACCVRSNETESRMLTDIKRELSYSLDASAGSV